MTNIPILVRQTNVFICVRTIKAPTSYHNKPLTCLWTMLGIHSVWFAYQAVERSWLMLY